MRWLLPLLCLLPLSCESSYRDHREFRVTELPFEVVWDLCLDSVRTEYRLDPAQIDRGLRQVTSRWRTALMAFGKGRRSRVYLEIKDVAGLEMLVRFYVEQQKVGDLGRQLSPDEDDWENAGQAGGVEDRLAYHISARVARAKGRTAPGPSGIRTEDPMKKLIRR